MLITMNLSAYARHAFPLALAATLSLASAPVVAAPKKGPETAVQLSPAGRQLAGRYEASLASLKAEITRFLPAVAENRTAFVQKAAEATKAAKKNAETAQKEWDEARSAKGLVDHAKNKWIGGADKEIAKAQAALKNATTEAQRDAAKKELAKWQANREEGVKALKEREAAWEKAQKEEPRLKQAHEAAQAALAKAAADEQAAVKALLAELAPVLATDRFDGVLAKAAVLSHATPAGLAEFAQQGREEESLVEKLLGSDALLREMLLAGGASGGRYGQAIRIYAAIRQASPKSAEGPLQRLALATALEHAVPIAQSNPESDTTAPGTVDPVKRYQHYEKAFLDGELDPAFKDFTTWEYRMVVDCDAPDHILAWGRQMLRAYRPDQTTNPDYGWRYSASVKTEVTYGSQNVDKDLPSLQQYQNIPINGGVCGRRAFYGRFILKSFGIPTWGVTQHKHAALSHWTPKGWVINLGAGFHMSWWDKDDAPRSGTDFLLETQAREHGAEYLKVLRAQWVSRVLGEQAFNDRKQVAGGFWSNLARHQASILASQAVALGPLGQELGEANETEKLTQAAAAEHDKKVVLGPAGTIIVPAVSGKASGSFASMRSHGEGMQIHCKGGFRSQYVFDAPQAGRYALTFRVASFQEGQKFQVSANNGKQATEAVVPQTVGLWQDTKPVEIVLSQGRNTVDISLLPGTRGLTLKGFVLKPIR